MILSILLSTMDNAVSVLLGFPPQEDILTDADYDAAVGAHLQQIDQLFRKDATTIAQQGVSILQVRKDHVLFCAAPN